MKAFERLAIAAALSGERDDVRAALAAHPLVGGRIGDVDPLLDALLEANEPVPAAVRRGAVTANPPSRMLREIGEAPAVVERILAADAERRAVAAAIAAADPRWVMIAGRGTSDHAGVYAQYLVEARLGLLTGLVKPSVTTIYGAELDWRGGLVLAISQSGRSPDIVAVVEAARSSGALTLAITNAADSPLADAAELHLDCLAGPELAVPATKTYVAELVAIAALVDELSSSETLHDGLERLPAALRATLNTTAEWLAGPGAGRRRRARRRRPRPARVAWLQPRHVARAGPEAQGDLRPLSQGRTPPPTSPTVPAR